MAKRYIDTGFYKSPFVRSLKGQIKALYSFIICDCESSGIWVKDLQAASLYAGFDFKEVDFEIFLKSGKAIDLNNGKFFFPDFIEHQYPNGLKDNNPANKKAIAELLKYNLINENFEVVRRPSDLPKVGTTIDPLVMVKVTVEEEVMDKVIVKGEKNKLILPYDSEEFKIAWESLLKTKKWRNKSEIALQASLKKLSKEMEQDAIQMIENTIAGEWQGLFELKNTNNNNGKTNYGNANGKKSSLRDYANQSRERLAGNGGINN